MSYLNKATNTICGALPIGMMTWLIYILVKHNDYSDCVIPAMFGAEPRPNGNSGNDVSGAPRFIKSHMEVTAKELQAAKIDAELSIMEILQDFNDLCVANDFQLEGLVLNTQETDQDRVFDVDILIL